jgi:hypothetical protein
LSRGKIHRSDVSISKAWGQAFLLLTVHRFPKDLPEKFLRSCYSATLYTVSEYDSEPDESKSGSDETVVTPMDEEGTSHFPPGKEEFVFDWVRWGASHSHECVVPTAPKVSREQGTKLVTTPPWRVPGGMWSRREDRAAFRETTKGNPEFTTGDGGVLILLTRH